MKLALVFIKKSVGTKRIAVFFLAAISVYTFTTRLYAGSNHNLSGWAWSENIGWISFNSSNCDSDGDGLSDGTPGCPQGPRRDRKGKLVFRGEPMADYGVSVGPDDSFSGYAWSEHIGWISFEPSETSGCPAAPCGPTLNRSQQKLEGWAKALAADGDGWDGWIRLSGANYGVTASGCNYNGYAWGSDVVGWIHFRGTNYGVIGSNEGCGIPPNGPPSAGGGGNGSGSGVTASGGGISVPPGSGTNSGTAAFGENPAGACEFPLRPTLSWTYFDPDNDPQKFYQVQVDDGSDFSSPLLDTGKTQSPTNSYILPADPSLAYNASYYWRVQVWDDRGGESGWTAGPSFATQPHQAPSVNYSWNPFRPNKSESAQFTDQTRTFGGAGARSWSWRFPDGAPAASNQQNPIARFNPVGPKNVSLIVEDSDRLSCGLIQEVGVEWPTDPRFREIVPK